MPSSAGCNVLGRYAFCPEPRDGVIDLCEDDDLFYFNPYSGELSLEFPTAEINCRGGILAYVTRVPMLETRFADAPHFSRDGAP